MALSVEDPTILQEAESLINGDRQQQYGGASESFTRIGELWGAYLGAPVSALDVANLMVLLKVSRTKGKYHRDSYVDIAGYSALAERITAEDATLGVLLDTPLEYVEEPEVKGTLTIEDFDDESSWADSLGHTLSHLGDGEVNRNYGDRFTNGSHDDYSSSNRRWVASALSEYGPYTKVIS